MDATMSKNYDFAFLEPYRIKNAPDTLYYVPDFISQEDEEALLKSIYSAPKPKWTQLANRRLQNWGGLPHPKGMIEEQIPASLKTWMERIDSLNVFAEKKSNHVLVNEYLPGQGIMPHLDGPLFYPTITTISLKSHTVLKYYTETEQNQGMIRQETASIALMPRSLLVVQHDFYCKYLHGIEKKMDDVVEEPLLNWEFLPDEVRGKNLQRGERISITIRHVPGTRKLNGLFRNR